MTKYLQQSENNWIDKQRINQEYTPNTNVIVRIYKEKSTL